MTPQKEKALSWLVTDLEFRKKAASIIASLNRKKAKPENMKRSQEHYDRLAELSRIRALQRKQDKEAGIIRHEVAEACKDAGIGVEEL